MSSYSLHVQQFVPGAVGEELELRIALLTARDFAAALRGRSESFLAHSYSVDAHELAGEFVFGSASIPRMQMATDCCRSLVKAAMIMESLFPSEFQQ